MVKNDILDNEVIDLGVASVETKGAASFGDPDNDTGQKYASLGIQPND